MVRYITALYFITGFVLSFLGRVTGATTLNENVAQDFLHSKRGNDFPPCSHYNEKSDEKFENGIL